MIITCKGTKKNGKFEKCSFLHSGDWGDKEIVSHQQYHETLKDDELFWLGFETSLSFGKFSGRDGK